MGTADRIGLHRPRWRVPRLGTVAFGLVASFAVLVGLELTGALKGLDSTVLTWMLVHRSSEVTEGAVAVTNSGTSPLLLPSVAAAGVLVGLRMKRWRPGLAAMAVLVIGLLSRLGLSKLVADSRPPQVDWLVTVHGFSFPSGHAATSALVAGTLCWLLGHLLPGRAARLAVGAGLGAWALLVGLSRMYLGVHWVSDILGSWLLAGAWLTCLLAAEARLPHWRRPTRTATP